MESDPYSLSNLRDIFVPDAPAFWPPAPGVWVALGIVVVVLSLVYWRWHMARKRGAYRKAGLRLLSGVKTAHDVSVVMKRVALAVFSREQVASLYGDAWAAFLHKTCPSHYFLALVAAEGGSEPEQELVDLASVWIRHHHVAEVSTSTVVH